MSSTATARQADTERFFAVDEQGAGMRATWRPAHGFVNLSLWRDQRCVDTFHLAPVEAGRLIGFLATALAGAVPPSDQPPLRVVDEGAVAERRPSAGWRTRLADVLDRTAARLRR